MTESERKREVQIRSLTKLLVDKFRRITARGDWPYLIYDVSPEEADWPWGEHPFPAGLIIEYGIEEWFRVFRGISGPKRQRDPESSDYNPRVVLYWTDYISGPERMERELLLVLHEKRMTREQYEGLSEQKKQARVDEFVSWDAWEASCSRIALAPLSTARAKCVNHTVWTPACSGQISVVTIVELLEKMDESC